MHLLSTIQTTSAMLVFVCVASAVLPASISAQQADRDSGNDPAKQAAQNGGHVESDLLPG